MGYSIGKWLDTDGDGRYDTLEVETRNFKGPRTYEPAAFRCTRDNETVIKERIFLDKADHGSPARRDHHHRPRLDAALDGGQALSPHPQASPGMKTIATRTTSTS